VCAEKCSSLSVRRACRFCPLATRLACRNAACTGWMCSCCRRPIAILVTVAGGSSPAAPGSACAQALPCCIAKRASVCNGQCAPPLRFALPVGLLAVPLSQLGVGPEVSNNMGEPACAPHLRFTAPLRYCTPAFAHLGGDSGLQHRAPAPRTLASAPLTGITRQGVFVHPPSHRAFECSRTSLRMSSGPPQLHRRL
jgi:hypothetical protein